jgi:hypothetical protein
MAGDRAEVIVLIRAVARPPPGVPGHRCPGLLGRSVQSDAAAEGGAQPPASNATSKSIPAEPIRISAFPGDESTGSSISAYDAYRARGRGVFRK